MCLTIESGVHVAHKALYTIKCAEFVNERQFQTPYQSASMQYGRRYKVEMDLRKKKNQDVGVGFHSLVASKVLEGKRSWMPNYFDRSSVAKGFILYRLPKGTYYYLGCDGDIVSDVVVPMYPLVLNKMGLENNGDSFEVDKDLGHIDNLSCSQDEVKIIFEEMVRICDSYRIKLM